MYYQGETIQPVLPSEKSREDELRNRQPQIREEQHRYGACTAG